MIPDAEVKLTQMSKTAGCAAKIGPGTLSKILESLPKFEDPNLLVGIETSDDGAIYKVSDEVALIQTLDFFTPVVDDPYTFGQVAAANALSDIYAMGGEPKIALNIVAWPNCVNPQFLGEILRGGADKVKEAGAVLAGGHSIQDDEPKYGLSVTGFVHPDKVFKNCGARPGDVLLLTKPLGTGIVNTAVKAEMASPEAQAEVIRVMTTLNQKAKRVIEQYDVHSCTDVTGFGLAGHSMEMAEGSGVTIQIHMDRLPIQAAAPEYARMGLVPAGAYRNRSYIE
ncbi:MAG: selenide, water dikinase SelD, partial [Hungatella sp.]